MGTIIQGQIKNILFQVCVLRSILILQYYHTRLVKQLLKLHDQVQIKACWLERLSMNGLTSSAVAKLKISPKVMDIGKAGNAFL